jgi:ribonuclease HI
MNTDDGVLRVYTDGACSGNGTHSAVGGVGVFVPSCPALSVSEPLDTTYYEATNQRAELMAIFRALQLAKKLEPEEKLEKLIIYTDSTYAMKGLEQWSIAWAKNGWTNSKGEPVANQDLWKPVLGVYNALKCDVECVKVKGHSNNVGNDKADQLAKRGCDMARDL